jgi:hypothetical protein
MIEIQTGPSGSIPSLSVSPGRAGLLTVIDASVGLGLDPARRSAIMAKTILGVGGVLAKVR